MKYEYKKVTGYEQKKFIENGHTMFEEDVLQRLKRLAYLEEQLKQANGVNTEQKALHIDSVMPRRLTAENGAKGLLIGEFHETIICHDEDGEPYEVKMPVEWDTIKQIYAKIVDHYGA